ncbi:MAG: AAA family ATPase [Myxococcales bacterium]|nr:AAA family ATPase [Myxococcales bacterium]
MEHFHHFGLADDPFRNEPRLEFFFEMAPHRDALQRLDRGVRQTKSLCVLIGDVGSGKTMIARRLLDDLEEEVFDASMLVVLKGSADSMWMLTRLARQLEVEEPAADREALLAQVYEKLAIIREDGRHAVLIVDDAQALASPQTLAEVCGLLKLEYEERPLLSMVMVGVPALERALANDPVLARRADVKVRIAALDLAAATAYLSHRIQRVQGSPEILEADAIAALHGLGDGLPGLMNTLADNALFEAFLCGRSRVSKTDVERVYRDLGWAAHPVAESAATGAAVRGLDSEMAAVFETATLAGGSERFSAADETAPLAGDIFPESGPGFLPPDGPPKVEDDDVEDLLVELVEG